MFMNVTALHNKISNQQHLFERNTAQTKKICLFLHYLDTFCMSNMLSWWTAPVVTLLGFTE